eukprot:CAMPEP_0117595548 /NCGR_PEP_ID=MMETSP0784-20121206/73822_1 /TAXON_ID=39447 /ORGANISM="" /LENGTH=98 /DNA_ID=CAMNT_0005397739 /DNA_START=22 /DNA_END=315 /DNA_ORIENTATION=-
MTPKRIADLQRMRSAVGSEGDAELGRTQRIGGKDGVPTANARLLDDSLHETAVALAAQFRLRARRSRGPSGRTQIHSERRKIWAPVWVVAASCHAEVG